MRGNGDHRERGRVRHGFRRDIQAFLRRQRERSHLYLAGTLLMIPAVGLALSVFLGMVRLVADPEVIPQVDLRMQQTVEGILTPGFTRSMVLITAAGGTVGMTLLTVVLGIVLWRQRWWSQLVELLIAMVGGAVTIFLMKAFFQRARPAEALLEVRGLSFPSGHSFISVVFFGFCAYLLIRSRLPPLVTVPGVIVSLLLIPVIGFSRIYLGVHFLTDVLGGFAAGFVWLLLTLVLVRLARARSPGEPRPQS